VVRPLGFFVAAEFAIVAVRRSRIDQLASEGSFKAKSAQDILRNLDTFIAACQLRITMASLALGWVGEPALAGLVERPIEWLFGTAARGAADFVAIAIAFTLITALHIVLAELVPKGLALQRPEGTTFWVARSVARVLRSIPIAHQCAQPGATDEGEGSQVICPRRVVGASSVILP
jgi:putative hemolysin